MANSKAPHRKDAERGVLEVTGLSSVAEKRELATHMRRLKNITTDTAARECTYPGIPGDLTADDIRAAAS